jgi:four helix bundle protein
MSRDPNRLKAFHLAHALVLTIFRHTHLLPREQRYVLQPQLQRAALSITCNLVEGCARRTLGEYRHFVNISLASARETAYLLSLAQELQYLPASVIQECRNRSNAVVGSLQNLHTALEGLP